MKYIKLYEDIEWDFEEEEYPDIHPGFEGHEDFYYFLVENDALESYLYNIYKNDVDLNKFLNSYSVFDYISGPFVWRSAGDLYDSWVDIDEKWRNRIRLKNKNIL